MARPGEIRKLIGILLGLVACIVPALLVSGFFGARVGSWTVWLLVAAGGGAVAGVLSADDLRRWYIGALAGPVAGAGALLLTSWWASWRSSVYSTELLLVALLGAIPGFIVGALIARNRRAPDPLPAAEPARSEDRS